MTLVLMIARKARMHAWHWRQIRRRRRDGLDPRLLGVGDDRYRRLRSPRLGGDLLQDLHLAIDAQSLRHLLLEFAIATFQTVAPSVGLSFVMPQHRAHP